MSVVSIVVSPLIGAPSALPIANRLHHSVVIAPLDRSERHLLDVVPVNPTDPKQLFSLARGKTVAANARCKRLARKEILADSKVVRSRVVDNVRSSSLVSAARRFQAAYFGEEPTMNLYNRNCVMFATCVLYFVS